MNFNNRILPLNRGVRKVGGERLPWKADIRTQFMKIIGNAFYQWNNKKRNTAKKHENQK